VSLCVFTPLRKEQQSRMVLLKIRILIFETILLLLINTTMGNHDALENVSGKKVYRIYKDVRFSKINLLTNLDLQ
jgi:hypothetical protein